MTKKSKGAPSAGRGRHGRCIESEQVVLGSILCDSSIFRRVARIVSAQDFICPANRLLFAAVTTLAADDAPIDVISVTATLRKLGTYERVGGAAYLAELLEALPSEPIHWECHAVLVARMSGVSAPITSLR